MAIDITTLPLSSLTIFTLPPNLLNALQPHGTLPPTSSSNGVDPSTQTKESSSGVEKGEENGVDEVLEQPEESGDVALRQGTILLSCATCGVTSFSDVSTQRSHFGSDWHRYNLKRKLSGKGSGGPVSEEEWAGIADDLASSISGSESSASTSSSSDEEAPTEKRQPGSPILWFSATEPHLASNDRLGIYSIVIPPSSSPNQDEDKKDIVKRSQTLLSHLRLSIDSSTSLTGSSPSTSSPPFFPPSVRDPQSTALARSRTWTLFMFGGGHFAGMVVSLIPKIVHKGGNVGHVCEPVVIEHKTFHRYTTRRKQGGAQSANDNSKGNAKSAGAGLRRYNEMALTEDVRSLLKEWSDLISGSELIFIRAGKRNMKTFVDYQGAVLGKDDQRLRTLPFQTRRPTFSELLRCFNELIRPKVSQRLSAESLALLSSQLSEPSGKVKSAKLKDKDKEKEKQKQKEKEGVKKPTQEELRERDLWERLLDMVKKGRLEALVGFVEKYGTELGLESATTTQSTISTGKGTIWRIPDWVEESRLRPTVLHLASGMDQPDIVRWLLVEKKADPTLFSGNVINGTPITPIDDEQSSKPTNTSNNIADNEVDQSITKKSIPTPYELAPSRETRNVFRRAMADHPDWWDWAGVGPEGARVPSALTEEDGTGSKTSAAKSTASGGRGRRAGLREKIKERKAGRVEEDAKEREREKIEEEERKKRAEEEERAKAEERRRAPNRPQRLGGGGGSMPGGLGNVGGESGLSEEARRRLERERRARAAEARMGLGKK